MMEQISFEAYLSVMNKINRVIGGKWKPGIIHLIGSNINRFGALHKHIPGISKKVLTECLRTLENDTLIRRETAKDTYPRIVIYHLTKSGNLFKYYIDQFIIFGLDHFKDDFTPEVIAGQLTQLNTLKTKCDSID